MRSKIIEYLNQHSINVYIPDYKTLYIAMIVIALALSTILAKRRGFPWFKFYLTTALICVIAFIGGRIYFILQNIELTSLPNFLKVLSIKGTASYGVYLGGLVGALFILRYMKFNVLTTLDIYAPVMALSLSIGRLGCFMSGCCHGKPSLLPWAISFPPESPPYLAQLAGNLISNNAMNSLPVHPTQIYESLFGLIMFIILLWLNGKKNKDGLLFSLYIMSYASFRFFIEFLRGDERGLLFTLSIPQIFSIVFFMIGVFCIIYSCSNNLFK